MARRRTARIPDWMAYRKAMAARKSILHVIAPHMEQDPSTGLERFAIEDGSAFVIKVKHETQESILLTCAHVVSAKLIPDTLAVRRMLPYGGVQQYPAYIMHIYKPMDVAVLRVPGLTAVPSLMFSRDDPAVGDGITAVGYCDASDDFLSGFSSIPAIHPGRIRGVAEKALLKRIRDYRLNVSCVAMTGMSGGPIISRRGVVGMMSGREANCNFGVHRLTIFGLLKRFTLVAQQDDLTMDDVIDRL